MENKKGFTLAEVLITLTIIGIVAALTIPTLINNINEAQYNAGIKNTYTTLSNALSMIQSNNQGIIHIGGSATSNANLMTDFCNVMSCTQSIGIANLNRYADYGVNNWDSSSVNGEIALMNQFGGLSYVNVLNNGTYLWFMDFGDCDPSNWGNFSSSNVCGGVFVDISCTYQRLYHPENMP